MWNDYAFTHQQRHHYLSQLAYYLQLRSSSRDSGYQFPITASYDAQVEYQPFPGAVLGQMTLRLMTDWLLGSSHGRLSRLCLCGTCNGS